MLGEEPLEESLRQILRIVRIVSLSPHESVERIPIRAAEPFQSRCGIPAGCLQDDRPMGGLETGV